MAGPSHSSEAHQPGRWIAPVGSAPLMSHNAVQVTLPVFSGPLDLLLRLIERQELDITQVSLALVTNQFLEAISQLDERDADVLASFLVVAAKLLVIKSRVLLPHPPNSALPAAEEADLGQDLVQQLIEYRKFRQVACWLRELEARGLQSFVRMSPAPTPERAVDLAGIGLSDLLDAARRVLMIRPAEPSVDEAIPPLTITVGEQMELIAQELGRSTSLSFLKLLSRANSRLEVVVTLLALLEMIKQGRVAVRQEELFGDILISAPDRAAL